ISCILASGVNTPVQKPTGVPATRTNVKQALRIEQVRTAKFSTFVDCLDSKGGWCTTRFLRALRGFRKEKTHRDGGARRRVNTRLSVWGESCRLSRAARFAD